MRRASSIITFATAAALLGLMALLFYLSWQNEAGGGGITGDLRNAGGPPVLRIGLIPERDIFAQRRRYQALAAHLSNELDKPVNLVTLNAYESALEECAENRIDAVFTGSLLAVLMQAHANVQVVAKPVMPEAITTYRGELIVPLDSSIGAPADLGGKRLAMVKLTTAGQLFASDLLTKEGLALGAEPNAVKPVWVGTHDDVIREVLAGRADAGAVKDLRLDAYESSQGVTFRRLAHSDAVPNNALLICQRVPESIRRQIRDALLSMDASEAGREALATFGAERFVPCEPEEYAAVHEMLGRLGAEWQVDHLPHGPVLDANDDMNRP